MGLSWEEFTGRIVACGLLGPKELDQAKEELTAQGRTATAEELRNHLVRQGRLTRFQASCLWEGKTQWLVFGEYIVLDKIGQGGMGMVLKAQHRRMDRLVAIKTLRPQALQDPKAVERFYREVKAAARLNHPNIVTAYDAGEHQGIHYLVMEYVDGPDLARLVKQYGPMAVPEALDYIIQAARGLQYAHQQGIIHRDIKPSNLLLAPSGVVKILDMGLARVAPLGRDPTTGDQLTGTGQVMGTCDYMAPEQAVSTHHVDHRADIYSLGCTLYRLLTGEPPYKGQTLVEVLMAHRDAPIPSLRAARPEVSDDLDRIFQRMVAKRPEDRFASMAEVIRALEACLVGVPVGSDLEGPAEESSMSTSSALQAWLAQRAAEEARKSAAYEETETWHPPDADAVTRPALDAGAGRAAEGKLTARQPEAQTPAVPVPSSASGKAPAAVPPPVAKGKVPASVPPVLAGRSAVPSAVQVRAAAAGAGWWAGLRQALGQMPAWVWGLAAALPVLLVALVVVLVVVFRQQTPVRETARAMQAKSAKGPTVTPSQPGQQPDSQGQQKPSPEGPHPGQPSQHPEAETTPPAGPEQKPQATGRLVLHWPKADRQEGKLDLNGVFMDMEKLADPHNPDQLKLALPAGDHTLWLARRGYEPLEQTVRVEAGQEVVIRPEWRKAPAMPVEPPKPEEKPTPKPEEKPAAEPKEKPGQEPKEKPAAPETPAGRPAILLAWEKLEGQLQQWEAQDAQWKQKAEPIEELVGKWQFAQALEKAQAIQFAQPDLQRRWQVRQQELQWLSEWKDRLIQKICSASTPPKKMDLGLRGLNGDVVEADQEKLTCRLPGEKTDTLPWDNLGPQAPQKLAGFVLDPAKPEDLLKAAVFLAAVGQAAEATRYFAQAQQKGLSVQEHLELASYPLVQELVGKLRQKEYPAARSALERLEAEPSLAPWRTKHQEFLDSIRAVLSAAQRDAEAEKLYTEAVKLYKEKELYDVKPLVVKLKSEYADTTPMLDASRQPTVAEMEQATAGLGRRITVAQKGKADFRTIQAAIDAAYGGDLIEIQDIGPYSEAVTFSSDKNNITLSGRKGVWPLLISLEPNSVVGNILRIEGSNTTIRRMAVVNRGAPGRTGPVVAGSANLELMIFDTIVPKGAKLTNCIVCFVEREGPMVVQNSLCLRLWQWGRIEAYNSIILEFACYTHAGSVCKDCIIGKIENPDRIRNHRLEYCVTFKDVSPDIERGPGCIQADPMFRDPKNLDYRLQPGSPCIGKASDGGDIGVRWTPEMLELVKVALELRRRGLIKF
ncbi:MAG: protein kinase [Thermoguttaceae bacterium]|nr:protein kinase [Thermoguttaceae bacterium]MDW8037776.1 protein kinase [Thermoguttaceae bacterium]